MFQRTRFNTTEVKKMTNLVQRLAARRSQRGRSPPTCEPSAEFGQIGPIYAASGIRILIAEARTEPPR
jgi:hypothetical protein